MFAIIMVVAALLLALLGGVAVAKRSGVKGVPAKKKPNTEPPGLQLERSLERSSALGIEHEADKTAAHTNHLDDKRKKEIKKSQEITDLHRRLSMEQEPQPKKKPFLETLREQLADVKPPARDLSKDRDRGRDRGMER
jgi:hypothetical protein